MCADSSDPKASNTQSASSKAPTSGFRRFWNSGGRVLTIFIPSFILVHYLWMKMQFMEEFIPEDKQKALVRAGPILFDKDAKITLIKASELGNSFEIDDRKSGK